MTPGNPWGENFSYTSETPKIKVQEALKWQIQKHLPCNTRLASDTYVKINTVFKNTEEPCLNTLQA